MSETVAHVLDNKFRTGDVEINENVDFNGLFLSKNILQGLNRAGFVRPSPIQLKAIPVGRCGLDLIIQAKSGTGKTCVFTVIALEGVIPENHKVQALILAPTREIAFQNAHVVQSVGSCIQKLRSYAFTGGIPLTQDKLKLKSCHVATGTPGRVKQLIEEGTMITDSIRLFVLDEADKLLDEGFQDTINWIYSRLPENKQIIAASATYPEDLAKFLMRYMRNPTFVRLNSADPALLGVKQYYRITSFHPLLQKVFDDKVQELLQLLNKIAFNQCIIFSNYQVRAQLLCDLLTSRGWPTMYISGSQDQQQRMHVMSTLHKFQCRILISTDLTSRGIDAEHVNLVINLDVPWDCETYLHRIGRAGRFGTVGIAVTFASKGKEEELLSKIKTDVGLQLIPLPSRIDNTIWQLDSSQPESVNKLTTDPVTVATKPTPKVLSNPFEMSRVTPTLAKVENFSIDEPVITSCDSRRDSTASTSTNDSASTDQSVHTVISRCQSTANEEVEVMPPESEMEPQVLPSVISRCDSTTDANIGGENPVEEYIPTSVKNRIHEFEKYIVKLINGNQAALTVEPTEPEVTNPKRVVLKDTRNVPAVKSDSLEDLVEETKAPVARRLVKSDTWDPYYQIGDKKLMTKSITIEKMQIAEVASTTPTIKSVNVNINQPEKKVMQKSVTIDLHKPKDEVRCLPKSESLDGNVKISQIKPEKCKILPEAVLKQTVTPSLEVKSKLEVKLKEPVHDHLVTKSYEDLLSDLEDYIDSELNHGDNVSEKDEADVGQDDPISGSGDMLKSQKSVEVLLEKMTDVDKALRMAEVEECNNQYQKDFNAFSEKILADSEEKEKPVGVESEVKKVLTVDLQVEEKEEETVVKTEESTRASSVEVIPSEQFEDNAKEDQEQSDTVQRLTLLSRITSDHQWVFSSSSIDPPESDNDKETTASEETDLLTSDNEVPTDNDNESGREAILPESTTENETTEEEEEEEEESGLSVSASSSDNEELNQSEPTDETRSAEMGATPDIAKWTEYWQAFSEWASQMHSSGTLPSDNMEASFKGASPHPCSNMMPPPFMFMPPQMPCAMPSMPQGPSSMWPPMSPYPGYSPYNSCCNCSMAAFWSQYWSFYHWQMMMRKNVSQDKE